MFKLWNDWSLDYLRESSVQVIHLRKFARAFSHLLTKSMLADAHLFAQALFGQWIRHSSTGKKTAWLLFAI
jgi:hypothetical protein